MRFKLCIRTLIISLFLGHTFCCLHAQSVDSLKNTNVTDSVTKIIGDISVIGNKITKAKIIIRELSFKKGDTISAADFEHLRTRSEQNIFNTSLFNSVHITWLTAETGLTNIYIIVTERWYIFPLPIFEIVDRNFNVWWNESAKERSSRLVYGGAISWNNFRGRNETVDLEVRSGYTQRVNFSYSIPYITHQQNSGLNFHFAYSRTHQTNYATYEDNPVYYKDTTNFSIKGISGSVEYTFRKGLYITHYADAGYVYASTEDTVQRLNPEFFAAGKSNQRYFILRYLYKSEHRDYIYYPLKGYEYDVEAAQNGFSFLHDDISYAYFTFNYRKYWELSKRWYFSSGIRGKISDNNYQPYFNIRALGYGRDVVRGYEYYITDGQNFGLLKTNLKFVLLPKKEFHAGIIPLEKFATIPFSFYLNVFADVAYAQDKEFSRYNPLTNSWLFGYGGGLDFLTYYDIVLRFDYSFNRMGESGFFLHFTAPI